MNYTKTYNDIINTARASNRSRNQGIYYENHHVIPKCLGGSNDKENLVLLTAREHFICHKLLPYIYPGNSKITYALHIISYTKTDINRKISARDYERIRILISENCKGYVHTEESRKKMSLKLKGLKRTTEQIKRNSESHMGISKGVKQSKEHIEKRVACHIGSKRTPEQRENIRNSLKGKKVPQERIDRTRISMIGKNLGPRPIVKCPHCGKEGGVNNMYRYHFENCKRKPE